LIVASFIVCRGKRLGGLFNKKYYLRISKFSREMREIQMVDLRAQYEKIGLEIDHAIKEVYCQQLLSKVRMLSYLKKSSRNIWV